VHAILSLLLVSLSVGLSNFAGAIGIGLSGINVKTRIRVGLAFGFFEALMPALGLLLGHQLAWLFGGYGKYVGGAILILTGAYTLFQERVIKKDQTQRQEMSSRGLLVTALALSIDNLAVGFALAVYPVDVWLAALTFGVVSIVMSLLVGVLIAVGVLG